MITLEAVAADLHSLADRFDSLADRLDARANEHSVALARIEERQSARMEVEASFRSAMSAVPERLTRVEEKTDANARAIEGLDGRGWDRWILAARGLLDVLIGPGGFLRSAQGIAVAALLAVVAGALSVDQVLQLWASVPTLVPVPIPQP